ncbi:MAG: hypothetical protein NC548_05755 [Lachnospiraceae bacterium]|nr:hypothetical protein [Lachnospiraceae bacterium]
MGTVFTEKVVVDATNGEVVFDGVDFTLDGYIEVRNASSLTIRNCRFYRMNLPDARNYLIKVLGDIPCKLVVEKCFFGDNPKQGSNNMYNLIEPVAKLKTGSSFSNNYFTAAACTHNQISIYGAMESSKLYIDSNVFEQNGGIRIGVKGEPTCTLYIRKNISQAMTSDFVDNMILLQPYGKSTTSFANMTIVCDGNQCHSDKYPLAWFNAKSDLQLTDETLPKVIDDKGNDIRSKMWQLVF